MEFRNMVTITLCTRQQKRHWCIEQSYGLWERVRVGRFGRMALKQVKYHVKKQQQQQPKTQYLSLLLLLAKGKRKNCSSLPTNECKYSWPLNNTGLNCTGPLQGEFVNSKHYSTTTCGCWNPSMWNCGYGGTQERKDQWKVTCRFLTLWRTGNPNPCDVQWSTVFKYYQMIFILVSLTVYY